VRQVYDKRGSGNQFIFMKHSIDVVALVVLMACLPGVRQPKASRISITRCWPPTASLATTRAPKIGGLALDGLDLQAASVDARTWEKALRKLRDI